MVGSAVLSPLFPLIALALGIVLRSTAAAIIAVLAVIFGPPFLAGVLPQSWQGDALDYVPVTAGDSIAIGHLPDAAAGLSPAVARARRRRLAGAVPRRRVGRVRTTRRLSRIRA